VEEEPSGRVVDYVYDATNRLISESITEPGKEDRILTYSYDKVGNRLTKTENGPSTPLGTGFTTTYVYDANNRLIKEACPERSRRDDVTYSYDENGNLIEKQSAEEQKEK
jgi:YD repeat-containing protein